MKLTVIYNTSGFTKEIDNVEYYSVKKGISGIMITVFYTDNTFQLFSNIQRFECE